MSAQEGRDGFEVSTPEVMSHGGKITADAPVDAAKPYWRITYYQHSERRYASGGRTRATAEAKVAQIVKRLSIGQERKAEQRVEELLAEYLSTRTRWTPKYLRGTRWYLERYVRVVYRLRCEELKRAHFEQTFEQVPTAKEWKQLKSRMSPMVTWGVKQGYLTEGQVRLFKSVECTVTDTAVIRPDRKDRADVEEGHITVEDVPSHDMIKALGDAMEDVYPGKGRLLVELAAYSGPRIGELLALSAQAVEPDRRMLHVHWQVDESKGQSLKLPKNERKRTVVYPERTPSGYDLAAGLHARKAAALEEKEAGTNPRALLFPSTRGSWWWQSNFRQRVWDPSCEAAGWPASVWRDETGAERRDWVYTVHSLRHRYATTAVDEWELTPKELCASGGWKTLQVVWERYYGGDRHVHQSIFDKTAKK